MRCLIWSIAKGDLPSCDVSCTSCGCGGGGCCCGCCGRAKLKNCLLPRETNGECDFGEVTGVGTLTECPPLPAAWGLGTPLPLLLRLRLPPLLTLLLSLVLLLLRDRAPRRTSPPPAAREPGTSPTESTEELPMPAFLLLRLPPPLTLPLSLLLLLLPRACVATPTVLLLLLLLLLPVLSFSASHPDAPCDCHGFRLNMSSILLWESFLSDFDFFSVCSQRGSNPRSIAISMHLSSSNDDSKSSRTVCLYVVSLCSFMRVAALSNLRFNSVYVWQRRSS